MHVRFLAVFAFAAGLCAWADDARAQGSAETDRAALVAVYRATGGEGWTDNMNWLTSAPLGDWHGVEVNQDGRVTRLRLGGWDNVTQEFIDHGLTGSLPVEIGTLSYLRRLEISGNARLNGPIPPELSSLTHLEDLNLQANRLTGSIPAGLGRLANLKGLWLTRNPVSGQVPTELGSLTGLTRLDLRGTILSGPLPDSLTRLSALTWLQLEGSGLCVPDLPGVQVWLATIRDFTGAVCTGSPTFLRVVTQPGLGRLDWVHAVTDLNGDGRDDVLVGAQQEHNVGAPEERFMKTTLRILVGEQDGSFTYAPELVEGTIDARVPIVVADEFNGDGQADLAVFDYGGYLFAQRRGYGNPPQLFLSSPDGKLRPSDALLDAVRREHELRPDPDYSGPGDLHLKSATSGDIDGDGDVDLWVDSIGGRNVSSHFMVNNGDGTFTVDEDRAPPALRYNWPEGWYHLQGHLVDLDNDGDLDLALGQNRKINQSTMNQFSLVLANDGAGYYPARIELPHPAFNEGYTVVTGRTHFDVNGDGFQDLLLAHLRNEESLPNIPATGRHIQLLVNRGGVSFDDETAAWMGDQSATTPERSPDGNPLYNAGGLRMHDVDRDGCADLVMLRSAHVRTESPLVYRNDGSGRFHAISPVPFAGSAPYFGAHAVPADVNGDEAIDIVVPYREEGPDGSLGTADDFTMVVTLLNTTPAGPLRCRQRVTAVGVLPARTLYVGAAGAVAVVVPVVRAFQNALTYRASSSASGVATVSVSGSDVTVTPVAAGVATITVTATGADNSGATQRFRVTVLEATAFTDRLRPELVVVKALHLLELRTRIAALRARAGLPPARWTDPILTVGVTPVRRVHLTELRDALGETYDAAGRSRPTYTDPVVTVGMTAIKAVHVVELRNAIVALE